LYHPTKRVVNNANVDNEENLRILVQYKDCLVERCKENAKAAQELRESLREQLRNELLVRFVTEMEDKPESDSTNNNLVYYMCGYLLKTRKWATSCDECHSLLLTTEEFLPVEFEAADFTLCSSHGGLKLATPAMFQVFREVENKVHKHLQDGRQIYMRDSYEKILSKIGELNLLSLCCENHPDTLPQLIMEYVIIRFHFESKRYRNNVLSKVKTAVHSSMKKSKCVNTST